MNVDITLSLPVNVHQQLVDVAESQDKDPADMAAEMITEACMPQDLYGEENNLGNQASLADPQAAP